MAVTRSAARFPPNTNALAMVPLAVLQAGGAGNDGGVATAADALLVKQRVALLGAGGAAQRAAEPTMVAVKRGWERRMREPSNKRREKHKNTPSTQPCESDGANEAHRRGAVVDPGRAAHDGNVQLIGQQKRVSPEDSGSPRSHTVPLTSLVEVDGGAPAWGIGCWWRSATPVRNVKPRPKRKKREGRRHLLLQ